MQWDIKLAAMLNKRFSMQWGHKHDSLFKNSEDVEMWNQIWFEGLSGISVDVIKPALLEAGLNFAWPPSLAEFRELCEKHSGMLDIDTAFELAMRGDKNNALVEHLLKKLAGDDRWKMGTTDDRFHLFKKHYQKERIDGRNEMVKLSLQVKEISESKNRIEGPDVKKKHKILNQKT